jgi:hypothetical protein
MFFIERCDHSLFYPHKKVTSCILCSECGARGPGVLHCVMESQYSDAKLESLYKNKMANEYRKITWHAQSENPFETEEDDG